MGNSIRTTSESKTPAISKPGGERITARGPLEIGFLLDSLIGIGLTCFVVSDDVPGVPSGSTRDIIDLDASEYRDTTRKGLTAPNHPTEREGMEPEED